MLYLSSAPLSYLVVDIMSIVSDLRWICSGACGWVDSTRNY